MSGWEMDDHFGWGDEEVCDEEGESDEENKKNIVSD